MKIVVNNADFSRELALLEKVIGKKPVINVLSNILIEGYPGGLRMSATDLEIGVVGFCTAAVEAPGAVTLPAKKLVEIVRAQSDSTIALAEDTRGTVKFTSGKFTSRLQSLPAVDFPGIPPMAEPTIALPRKGLKEALVQVRFAISDKDSRYFTQGAYIAFPENGMTFVTTDSARLALTKLPRVGPARDAILVPAKCLDELIALLTEQGDSDVLFSQSDRHLFFDVDGRVLISRQVDGKFPAYERIIPKDNHHHAEVDRLEFMSVLKRLVLINEIVELVFSGAGLSCAAIHADVGDGAEHIDITYEGPEIVLRFRGQYLLDFLGAAPSDTITVALRDAAAPALLMDGEYQNAVMGMRV